MNKSNLRMLGIGFLASAMLTGAFAIFFQGNVPVSGVKVSSVLQGAAQNDQELSSYKEAMSVVLAEKSSLESSQKALNESINSLKESASQQSSELASLKKAGSLVSTDESISDSSSMDESTSTEENENVAADTTETGTTETVTPATTKTFVVNDGDSSLMIADRLVAEGILSSTDEFKAIIDQWDLSTILRSGSYEFTTDMNPHDVLEQLTNGRYYIEW